MFSYQYGLILGPWWFLYREVVEEYTKETKMLSERLLGVLSEGLELRHDALKKGLGGDKTEYVMRINNFPPNPKPDSNLGLPEHTDIIAMALIVTNEVPGLQIFKDDRWFDVQYIPSAITITIGDQILVCFSSFVLITSNSDQL